MLLKSSSKAFGTLLLSILTLSPFACAATGQGSVSLWSNSDCAEGDTLAFTEPVVISLNKTLDADVCGDLPREAHSYRVDRRPTCANGETAGFAFYGGHNCQEKGFGPALNTIGEPGEPTEFDGECLALVTFTSVAFICEGVGEGDVSSSAAVTSTATSEPTSLPTTAPASLSSVGPPYAYSSTSAGYSAVPTGTQPASGILPSGTGGLVPFSPSPSPFTGAASGLKTSVWSAVIALGLRVFI